MSDRGHKSDPPGATAKKDARPRPPRSGYATMPTELRVFQGPDPTKMSLEDMPEAAEAAEKLREMGRGDDVLYEDLRAAPPREPTANDNRAEHAIVEIPARGSPWAADAAKMRAAAEAIDKGALPSSTAPASVEGATGVTSGTGSGTRGRRWIGAAVLGVCVVGALSIVLLREAGDERTDGNGSSVPDTGSGHVEAIGTLTGSAPRPVVTSEPAVSVATSTAAMSVGAARGSTAVAQPPAGSDSARPAPRLTGDPYGDGGSVPPAATAEPSGEPVATGAPTSSAAAAPTLVPSAPSITTSTKPVPTTGPILDRED